MILNIRPEPDYNPFLKTVLATKCIRNRYAAYKILMNLVYSKNRLFKIGLVDSPLCDYCSETEDKKHLLFECKQIIKVWRQVASLILQVVGVYIDVTIDILVYGWQESNARSQFINTMLNHFKMLILHRRYKKWSLTSIKNEFNFICRNEKPALELLKPI